MIELIELLPRECHDLLRDRHDEGAALLSEALAFLCLCQNAAAPLFMIVPGPQRDIETYQGLAFDHRSFFSVVSRQIPLLSRFQQPEQLPERGALISGFDQEAVAEEQRNSHESVWRRGATRLGGEDILFILDDDGSGHLLNTGLSALKEFSARGYKPFVLTSVDVVARAVMGAGFPAARLPFVTNSREYVLALERSIKIIAGLRAAAHDHGPGTPEWIFIHTVIPRISSYVASQVIAESILDEIGATSQPTCIFSINEALFLPMVAARWGRNSRTPLRNLRRRCEQGEWTKHRGELRADLLEALSGSLRVVRTWPREPGSVSSMRRPSTPTECSPGAGSRRFNGPNDGESCARVVDFLLDWRRQDTRLG